MLKYWFSFLFAICNITLFAQSAFDDTALQKMELEFYDDHWNNKLKAFKKQKLEIRIPAKLTLASVVYDSVAVRFKGNSSYNNPSKKESKKLPFNIDLNAHIKGTTLPDGSNKIKLSNSFRDPSYLREVLSFKIVDNYLPTPKVSFFHLFINGIDYGIYVGNSSINNHFLKENFGTKKGVLFKCDPDYSQSDALHCSPEPMSNLMFYENPDCYKSLYELKSKKGWKQLEKFIQKINHSPEELSGEMADFEFMWMLALNSVLVNLDSYTGKLSHNYYLYRDTFKVWHPIMWDLNLSFGGFPFDGEKSGKLSTEEMQKHSLQVHLRTKERPLISTFLSDEKNIKLYRFMIRTICEDFFNNGKYLELMKNYKAQIREAVNGSGLKLYSSKDFEDNDKKTVQIGKIEMVGIQELMEKRVNYLISTPVFESEPPLYLNHEVIRDSTQWIFKCQLVKADRAWLFTQAVAKGPWTRHAMNNNLRFWDIAFPIEERPHAFFIQMENQETASLFPTNAPRKFLLSEKEGFGSNFE